MKVETERPVSANRPDLVIKDHNRKMIYLVDVAVSHRNGITTKEREKIIKYETVRRELCQRTGYQAIVIPYVISWDGNVSIENWKYRKIMGISDKLHSYIQQIVLRERVDIVCRDILSPATSLVEKLTEEKVNRVFESHLEEYSEDDEKILADSSHIDQ